MEKAQDRENVVVVVPNDLGALGCYYTDFSGHALMLDLITNFKIWSLWTDVLRPRPRVLPSPLLWNKKNNQFLIQHSPVPDSKIVVKLNLLILLKVFMHSVPDITSCIRHTKAGICTIYTKLFATKWHYIATCRMTTKVEQA